MPQTTQSITAVSGSKKNAASAEKCWSPGLLAGLPASIQLKRTLLYTSDGACSPSACFQNPSIPKSSANDRIALHPTPIQIGQCELPLSHFAPKKPEIAAPMSGSNGISQ